MLNSVGPCAVQEDGAPVYCDIVYFGEQAISAAAGDLDCVDTFICSNIFDGVSKSIEVPIDSMVA
jgi:hypothetical protein